MEEKSEWGARRNIVWTGLVWEEVNFKLWVTAEKLVKAELLLEDLWKRREETVGVKEIARMPKGRDNSAEICSGVLTRSSRHPSSG